MKIEVQSLIPTALLSSVASSTVHALSTACLDKVLLIRNSLVELTTTDLQLCCKKILDLVLLPLYIRSFYYFDVCVRLCFSQIMLNQLCTLKWQFQESDESYSSISIKECIERTMLRNKIKITKSYDVSILTKKINS